MRFVLLFLALLTSGSEAQAQLYKPRGPRPAISLPSALKGAALVSALGDQLGQLAAYHGVTSTSLRALIMSDPCLYADRTGRLHYVCPGPSPLVAARAAVASGPLPSLPAGPFPQTQTFLLHSLPGATRVIYLDFDGHTTTGTAWNDTFTSGAAFTTPAYDVDGDGATFNADEHTRIQQIWQRVAEDFAPFNVDVTTEDPGEVALMRTAPEDLHYGVRACIGGSYSDWFGSSAGGVGYVGSFDDAQDTPVFIFENQLGNGAVNYVAEATSHEVGHALGLSHDGLTTGASYYEGHGDWAPIMGVSYYRPISQWSRGEYASANNFEDDTAIIASMAGLRADDHGGAAASATALPSTNTTASGIIGSRTDRDYFKFISNAGQLTVKISPGALSPNLDCELKLYNGGGSLLATASPADSLGATLSQTLTPGTYYLRVDGVGNADPASTGYSDYGSLGSYTLDLKVVETPRIHLIGIAMSTYRGSGEVVATARARLVDQFGESVAGASVSGRWTGNPSASTPVISAANGQAVFTSAGIGAGRAEFRVTGITKSGAIYEPTANLETVDAINY